MEPFSTTESQAGATDELSRAPSPENIVILAQGLWKTYDMEAIQVNALCGVSFSIVRGEYVAIMGPSG